MAQTVLLMTAMLLLQMQQLPMGSSEGSEPGTSGKRAEANVSPVHQVVAGPRPEPRHVRLCVTHTHTRVTYTATHTHVCVCYNYIYIHTPHKHMCVCVSHTHTRVCDTHRHTWHTHMCIYSYVSHPQGFEWAPVAALRCERAHTHTHTHTHTHARAATAHFRQAIQDNPWEPTNYVQLMHALFLDDQRAELATLMLRYEALFPDRANSHTFQFNLAMTLYGLFDRIYTYMYICIYIYTCIYI